MKSLKSKNQNGVVVLTIAFLVYGCAPAKPFVTASSSKSENSPLDNTASLPSASPIQPLPSDPFSGSYQSKVKDLAAKSSCAKVNWQSRGRSPAGYIKGMALSYARSLCRLKASGDPLPVAAILSSANSQDAKKDVLAHYQDILSQAGFITNVPGQKPLLATYTIGIGLGMRESSGKYCEGWDVAAGSNRTSSEAEAGLFQVSFDSIAASKELAKLYEEYKKNPKRCLLDVFKEGVSCKPRGILGSGEGAKYQEFNLKCPAFAAEYAMTLIRLRRSHFGPINRRAAQVSPACDSMLTDVQKMINLNPEATCKELF